MRETISCGTGAAVDPYRIVKFSADSTVVQAAASTDLSVGITDSLAAASGERIDVHVAGPRLVEFGGTVARGAKITADSDGKAVAAAPAEGVNAEVIGFAMVSAVDGDIALAMIAPSTMQGAA